MYCTSSLAKPQSLLLGFRSTLLSRNFRLPKTNSTSLWFSCSAQIGCTFWVPHDREVSWRNTCNQMWFVNLPITISEDSGSGLLTQLNIPTPIAQISHQWAHFWSPLWLGYKSIFQMVSLAQGKPGTLGQCHPLPRTRKDAECLELGGRGDGGHEIKGKGPHPPVHLRECHALLLHAGRLIHGALQHVSKLLQWSE